MSAIKVPVSLGYLLGREGSIRFSSFFFFFWLVYIYILFVVVTVFYISSCLTLLKIDVFFPF